MPGELPAHLGVNPGRDDSSLLDHQHGAPDGHDRAVHQPGWDGESLARKQHSSVPTFQKWLRAQPTQPTTLDQLQALLDRFRHEYNTQRPQRSLEHRATPAAAYAARPKATPTRDRSRETHDRVRTDKIDRVGTVTLRHNGRLHHIGVGRTHAGTYVRLLVQDLAITVINATTGEILRELLLDPTRDYQPTGAPRRATPK